MRLGKWGAWVKKLGASLLLLFCIVTINFALIRFMPGDPVEHILGESEYLNLLVANPEVIEEVRHTYGLDRSVFEQYLVYLTKTAQLDFGNSYRTKTPVMETITFRLRWTLTLAVPAVLLSSVLGGWLGLRAGWKRDRAFDRAGSGVMIWLSSIPENCIAIILLLTLAFTLRLFPLGGITSGGLQGAEKFTDILWHMVLPLSALILSRTPSSFLLMRSTVLAVREEEYVTMARGKGLREKRVMYAHVLKNALSPFIASFGVQFGHILSGAMLVELVFSWKGMGTLIYDSVVGKDYPMLQACFLFIGAFVILCNLLADTLCTLVDPRVREAVSHE